MPNAIAVLILLALAGTYSVRQALSVRRVLRAKDIEEEWNQRVLYAGAVITVALAFNGIGFLSARTWEYEFGPSGNYLQPDGNHVAPSPFALMIAQSGIIFATMALVVAVWKKIKAMSLEVKELHPASVLLMANQALQGLLLPFWLATFGIGSIFGISSGVGLRDIVRNTEFLLGPPLFLSLELTFVWFITKVGLWRATPTGEIPPFFQFLFRKRDSDRGAS